MHPHLISLTRQFPAPIGEQLRDWAMQYGQHIALVDGHRRWTYTELDQKRTASQGHFISWDCAQGIVFWSSYRIRRVLSAVLFALMRIGCLPILAMPDPAFP
ncbi:hypothetical protein P4S72_18875 [Vibrio sp. PP-XX7]